MIPLSYFQGADVVALAKDLIGKEFHSRTNGEHTAGMIVETEAYRGPEDRASHAYNNRRTKRTETMFLEGGRSYVYLCYGVHHLLNIVTNCEGVPHAILIRALWPTIGLEVMCRRRGGRRKLCAGPGMVAQALGITCAHDNLLFDGSLFWLEEGEKELEISVGPRIGVDYAGEDALLPWRFCLKEERWLSQRFRDGTTPISLPATP